MQNQLLLSIAAIGVAAAGMGVGTYAFFSDTAESTGNDFSAAKVVLHLSDDNEPSSNGVTASFSQSNVLPGEGDDDTLNFINDGTRAGPDVVIDFKFVKGTEADGCSTDVVVSCPDGAVLDSSIVISAITYDGGSLLDAGDCLEGVDSWDDMDGKVCSGLAAGAVGSTHDLKITWTLPTTVGNEAQGDTFTYTVTGKLRQSGDAPLA